ncbi:MAG: class E sortase [Candidatus Andersenbacteria bacterium]
MKRVIIAFVATFLFAFAFFYGAFASLATFVPFIALSLTHNQVEAQLPLSQGAVLSASNATPTGEAQPEVVVQRYPKQDPIDPIYDPADAGKDFLRIPSLGVNVPIAVSKSIADQDVINALQSGVAMYPNGVTPGALGNVFIAGHSTGNPWQGPFRFAFTRINELKPGDSIILDWHDTRYVYKIYKSETIVPTDGYTIASDHLYPTMSLMACWPLWSTSHRILIHADLTSITQLTTPK